jgi:hypothetical protein
MWLYFIVATASFTFADYFSAGIGLVQMGFPN